jgi:hypothetical protein
MWLSKSLRAACVCVVVAVPVHAANAVAEPDGKIVITVLIDLISPEDGIVEKWDKAIRDYWNDGPGFGYFKYCGRKVQFEPNIQPIAAGQKGRSDAHKIRMKLVADHVYETSFVRGRRVFNPKENRTGTWLSNASPQLVAHEFGHLLGLRDEYFHIDTNGNDVREFNERTAPLPEFRDGSLMATWHGKILQRHIDQAMANHGVKSCDEWQGSIEWTITAPTIRHYGTLAVVLTRDAQGALTGTLSGPDSFVTSSAGAGTSDHPCPMTMRTPGQINADLRGTLNDSTGAMSLAIENIRYQQGSYMIGCGPSPGPHPYGGGGPIGQSALRDLLQNLVVAPDGTVRGTREGRVDQATTRDATVKATIRLERKSEDPGQRPSV